MKTSRNQLVPVLVDMATGTNASKFARQVAAYLLSENRTGELNSLARDLIADRAKSGIVEVIAVTAHSLSSAAKAEIEDKAKQLYPGAKQIIIDEQIDSDMIGGVRLEFPDQQLDLSVRSKLSKLKRFAVNGVGY